MTAPVTVVALRAGAPYPRAPIMTSLADRNYTHVVGYTDGVLVAPNTTYANLNGQATLHLIPNEDITPGNTYYVVSVGRRRLLIEVPPEGGNVEDLLVADPNDLDPISFGLPVPDDPDDDGKVATAGGGDVTWETPTGGGGGIGPTGPTGATGPSGPSGPAGAGGSQAANTVLANITAGAANPTAVTRSGFRAWQGQERALLEFGDIPNDETTDMSAMIQAAIDSLDTNRAGTILFPDQGKLYIGTGLTAVKDGTSLVSNASPGTSDDLARGSLQILVGPGIWGLSVGTAGTATFRGYHLEGLQFFEKTAGTALGGLRIRDSSNGSYERIAAGRFTAGTGIYNAGTGGNFQSQYNTFTDCRVGDCLIGYRQTGANCTVWLGGIADGATNGESLTAGSIGFKIESGDTFRAIGTRFQGYDTLIELGGNLGHELHGIRVEIWETQAIHVLDNCRGAFMSGFGDNSLIGSHGAGVVIESGAEDTTDMMEIRDASGGTHIDLGDRTRAPRSAGVPVQASVLGSVSGKMPVYFQDGTLAGYAPLYDSITGIYQVKIVGQKQSDTTGVGSLVFTVPAGGIPAGHTLIIAGGYGLGSTITVTGSDSSGNTYTVDRHDDRTTGGTPHSYVMSAKITTGLDSGDSITVTFSSVVNYPIAHCVEYAGLATASWAEDTIGANGLGTSVASGDVTASVANDLLFASFFYSQTATVTVGDGFDTIATDQNTTKKLYSLAKTAGTAANYSLAVTLNTSKDWAVSLVAYKADGAV